jgi:hypothetical protein
LNSDGGFAKGIIDLGGLEARQVTTFAKVWTTTQGGQDGLGATFFKPSPVPAGFRALGHYAQPNNRTLFGYVLVAQEYKEPRDRDREKRGLPRSWYRTGGM